MLSGHPPGVDIPRPIVLLIDLKRRRPREGQVPGTARMLVSLDASYTCSGTFTHYSSENQVITMATSPGPIPLVS